MGQAWDRAIGVLGGLAGAAGVAASAAASHAYAGTNLGTAGTFLIMHGAALLALAAPSAGSRRLGRLAAIVMALGVALFAGDLSARALAETPLFPMAAPLGGLLLIASWLVAAISFAAPRGNG